ncbi:MAG: hypothetical protein ACOY0T_09510 [Myxococcota bacterium]
MADDLAYPTWTGSGGTRDAEWNTVVLGDVVLPGICTVEGLSCGINVNTKRAKGQDGPRSKDNGIEPSKFVIHVWLAEKHWGAWQAIVDRIHPRRPGRQRQPVEIKHPEPNVLGITHVRIISFIGEAPTGTRGKKYRIVVEEWFDEPKEVKVKKTANGREAVVSANFYFGDGKGSEGQGERLADRLARSQGYLTAPERLFDDPDDPRNVARQLFDNNTSKPSGF